MSNVIAKLHRDGTCVNNSKSLDYILRYSTKDGLVGVQFPDNLSNSNELSKTMKVTLRLFLYFIKSSSKAKLRLLGFPKIIIGVPTCNIQLR